MKVVIAVDIDENVLNNMSRQSPGVQVSQFVPWRLIIYWASRDKTGRVVPNGYETHSQFVELSLLDDTMTERIAEKVIDAIRKGETK